MVEAAVSPDKARMSEEVVWELDLMVGTGKWEVEVMGLYRFPTGLLGCKSM